MHLKKIRSVRAADLAQVVEIDAQITGRRMPAYWDGVRRRYGARLFLVGEAEGAVQGFIVGEVRYWAFGEPPCGWVFRIGVSPHARLRGAGTRLFEELCRRFRAEGIDRVRTLIARDNPLVLAFFRSQGMMAAPFLPMEKTLD